MSSDPLPSHRLGEIDRLTAEIDRLEARLQQLLAKRRQALEAAHAGKTSRDNVRPLTRRKAAASR